MNINLKYIPNVILPLLFAAFCLVSLPAFSQTGHNHDHSGHNHNHDKGHQQQPARDKDTHPADHGDHGPCPHEEVGQFDAGATAFHHIADANVYSIGPLSIPLPCILYSKDDGVAMFSSGKLGIGHHQTGHKAYKGYVLYHGNIMRVNDNSFPKDLVEPVCFGYKMKKDAKGHDKKVPTAIYHGKTYDLDANSTFLGSLVGGGITSFHDFSITKNVMSMILMLLFCLWLFTAVARSYKRREGQAPSGLQSLIEPVFVFIQDEVAKPFLGPKWEKYLPFLMSLFFFILALNLFGQIPFFGGSNPTGNISVTFVLAIITFLVVSFSGNAHYWEHVFWMPGVPAWVKTILTPVEVMGLFIKPLTLMLRLFANITAGHIVISIFVSLIFIFGNDGATVYTGKALGASVASILLGLFMMAIELLVAFLQAFVFTILTASYIGAAVEEPHHH